MPQVPVLLERMSPYELKQALAVARAEAKSRGLTSAHHTITRSPWIPPGQEYFQRLDGTPYNPTVSQAAFVHSPARFAGFFGGRGSGKTAAGAQRALLRVARGESGAIMNPDFENFRFSTWPELCQWIPWHKVHRSRQYMRLPSWEPRQAFTLPFKNGAVIVCKGLKDPEGGRGRNLNWLWYDEGGRDKTGMSWNIAIAGVRVGHNPSAWVTTTPKGRSHWLHRLFIEQEFTRQAQEVMAETETDRPLVESFHGSIGENRMNLDSTFYASMVAAYGSLGWLRDQELDGLFVEPGGNLADRTWFGIVNERPTNPPYRVRYWDLAATVKEAAGDEPDYTAGALVSWKNGEYFIEHVLAARLRWGEIKTLISQTAQIDGQTTPVIIEQEPGASGKNIIAEFQEMESLMGFAVYGHRPEGDKLVRANPWFAAASSGHIKLVRGEWNRDALDQIVEFPDGLHDDIVDAISGAFFNLSTTSMDITASVARTDRDRWSVGERDEISIDVTLHRDRDRLTTDQGQRWTI